MILRKIGIRHTNNKGYLVLNRINAYKTLNKCRENNHKTSDYHRLFYSRYAEGFILDSTGRTVLMVPFKVQ